MNTDKDPPLQHAGWHISFDGGDTWEYCAANPEERVGDSFAIVRPLVYGDGLDWSTPNGP